MCVVRQSSPNPVRDSKAPRCETEWCLPALPQSCDQLWAHVGNRWPLNVAPAFFVFFSPAFLFCTLAFYSEEIS